MAFNAKEWKPTKQQAQFLQLPWSIKEAFFGGAAGGGKSDLLLIICLVLQLYKNPLFKQLFTRRTYKELKLEIVPRSRELYPKFGATFNGSDMAWTFPRDDQYGSGSHNSGAMIFFGHCEHEADVHNYDSMEINLFTPDELTSFTEYMYLYIALTRVRTSDSTLPAIIRGAGMPGGIGHTFVKKRFVDPKPDGGAIIIGKAGLKRFYVHSSFDDNPHIDPTYRQSIEALPEAEKRAKKGDWDAFAGQVFDEFRDLRYPDEPDNALHVIDEFSIPEWWPKIVVGDWGFAAMTWIGFAAIAPNGRVFVYRELTFVKTKIAVWAPILDELIEKDGNVKLIRFCKSAGQDRGQTHTIQQQIEEHLGRSIELSENKAGSRVAGKMLLHEYFRWQPKPLPPSDVTLVYNEEMALRIYRIKGQTAYEEYLNQFNPVVPETNLPKLLFFKDKTKVVVAAIKACSYDKKRVEDIAEFDGDDPIDGLRYLADAADEYVKVAQKEMELVKQRDEYSHRLANTKDWTGFYRNMRRIEAVSTPMPIARYSRRRH